MDTLVERLLRDYVDEDDADELSRIHSRMERSLRDEESDFAWD